MKGGKGHDLSWAVVKLHSRGIGSGSGSTYWREERNPAAAGTCRLVVGRASRPGTQNRTGDRARERNMKLSHHAMPLMVFNLAGEMLYILNQRLQAQNLEKVSHRHSPRRRRRCLTGMENARVSCPSFLLYERLRSLRSLYDS